MKKILFLLLLFFNVCKAQLYSKYDDHKYYSKKYKGHIKQVINSYSINYHADSNKLKQNDTTRNAGFNLISLKKDSFNISGNIQKISTSYYIHNDTSKFSTREYSYDNANNLIAISYSDSNKPVSSQSIFKYNKGMLESVDEYDKKKFLSETVFFYNKKGVLKKTETTWFESKSLHKEKFVDDNTIETINYYNKRITSKSFIIQDDTSILYVSFPNLDDSNSTAHEMRVYKDGELYLNYYNKLQTSNGKLIQYFSTIETQYDEHKNLIKLVTYDELQKVNYTTTINYKYDSVGNITEKLVTYENGTKQLYKSRFEYY